MKHFTIFDALGNILRAGQCQDDDFDLQAKHGEYITEKQVDVEKDRINPLTGDSVPGGRVYPAKQPKNYSQARRALYPRIEEQLDMLWHAMNDGKTEKSEPFFSAIQAVKTSTPKQQSAEIFKVGKG